MRIALLTLLLMACGKDDPAAGPETPSTATTTTTKAPEVALLSPSDQLIRVAMAIKGTRPTVEEFDAVAADPEALAGIIDDYLASPQFGETVRDIENQTLLTRVENRLGSTIPVEAGNVHYLEWAHALFEEPLKLIEHVVVNDRPYTDIVTMEQTLGTQYAAMIWAGVADDFDPNGPEWQLHNYTDGRPTAGVLSTGGWNNRYASNGPNAHRRGAAAAASALICTDYLNRDVQLGSIDLTDDDAINQAILYNPACVNCHQTMDPLAGFFWGYAFRGAGGAGYPLQEWDPTMPGRTANDSGRPNGYYGLGGETMVDLGQLIAADHRFTACAARRYISWMSQIPLNEVPIASIASAQQTLIDSNYDIKAMVKSIALSDAFAVSHAVDPDPDPTDPVVGYLQTRPEQLNRMFDDLTGFTWETTFGNPNEPDAYVLNLATNSGRGFKVHGGSIDSDIKVVPLFSYSATASSFLRSYAGEAAGFVVEADFDAPADQRKLLHFVEADTTDEALIRDQLVHLHLLILGEDVETDSLEIDESYDLFSALQGTTGDGPTTWKIVLTALFQDFRVAYH